MAAAPGGAGRAGPGGAGRAPAGPAGPGGRRLASSTPSARGKNPAFSGGSRNGAWRWWSTRRSSRRICPDGAGDALLDRAGGWLWAKRTPHRTIRLRVHPLDPGLINRVLDRIEAGGGRFPVVNFALGQQRPSPSSAAFRVSAPDGEVMADLMARRIALGAEASESVQSVQSNSTSPVWPAQFVQLNRSRGIGQGRFVQVNSFRPIRSGQSVRFYRSSSIGNDVIQIGQFHIARR